MTPTTQLQVATSSLSIILIILMAQSAAGMPNQNYQVKLHKPTHINHLDPIVMNTKSLYRNNKNHIKLTRLRRSTQGAQQVSPQSGAEQQLVDACQSKMEILTPYYGKNSKGKLRTIINSELMQQAIQVETCVRSKSNQSAKCNAQADCGCEQKYKWHRLLVLDPRDSTNSRGLFMDWFLFPSNCVCRCKPGASKQSFLRTMSAVNNNKQAP